MFAHWQHGQLCNCNGWKHKTLQRVVDYAPVHHGPTVLPTIKSILTRHCLKKVTSIIKYTHNLGYALFLLLPSWQGVQKREVSHTRFRNNYCPALSSY